MNYHRPRATSFINRTTHTLLTILFVALILSVSASMAEASGELTLNPTELYFGSVWVGRSHTISVVLKNLGNATVSVSGDTLTGAGYSVSGIAFPTTLSAGASVTFTVKFAPAKLGSVTGKLELLSNASNSTFTVPLNGAGVAVAATVGYATVTPTSASFGDLAIGTKNTQNVKVANTGSASMSISSVKATGTGFSVSGITTPVTVAAGASTQFTVAFLPETTGSVTGSVTVTSTASDSAVTIALSGTGAAVTRTLDISPASAAFGNVGVGSSITQDVTLENGGNSSITITGAAVKGTGISATGVSGTTVAAGQSAVLAVEFAPKATGSVSGSITIASNATNGASIAIPITGTGVTATHAVSLKWQASSSTGVVGYNVYRSSVSGGSYAKLVSSPIAGTTYTDNGVSSGSEYYYVVTAVNSDGAESTYSNQTAITVP